MSDMCKSANTHTLCTKNLGAFNFRHPISPKKFAQNNLHPKFEINDISQRHPFFVFKLN